MASDSNGLANILAFLPELHKELDLASKDAVGKIFKPSFQRSKERLIIAEALFNKEPDLTENDQKELVALVKDAGSSKELKACLKDWESPPAGALSFFSRLISLFAGKEWTSDSIDEAVQKSRDLQDRVFLTDLQGKVSKNPLLEPLVQDTVTEAHAHLQEFMRQRLPRLYSHAHNIRQKAMHRQVEAEMSNQDQKRRVVLRSGWFDDIKMAQTQVNPGYIFCCLQVHLMSLKYIL